MKVSLVLSTFNGSQYIEEQLDSLLRQTRPLDEVLICDDCSTDNTPELIQAYIKVHQLNWKLFRNKANKGWKRNFHDLLYRASGDCFFLCDQDDIWLPNKIELMVETMSANPDIDVLSCSVDPFYEDGSQKTKAATSEADKGNELIVFQGIDEKAVYVQRPGCTYCVRGTFLKEISSYWDVDWAHDAVLWMLAETKGSLALYNRRLVRFRRHSGNASARRKLNRSERIDDLQELIERAELMLTFGEKHDYLTAETRDSLQQTKDWLAARIRFLETRDCKSFRAVMQNRSHYFSTKGLFADLAFACFRNIAF